MLYVSGDALDHALGAWLWTRTARADGRTVIAIDGKAVRGAKEKGGGEPPALGPRRTYQEDHSLVRVGNAPRVMAPLCSAAISLLHLDGHANIAEANRHHARDPHRTLTLLQNA